jgi:hypothetical protein
MLSPLYMAEISPPEVRGSLLALEQFSIVLGCVVGFWTGFLTRNGEPHLICAGTRHVELWVMFCSGRELVLANTPRATTPSRDSPWAGDVCTACFSTSPCSPRPKGGGSCLPRTIAASYPFRGQDRPLNTGSCTPKKNIWPTHIPKIELLEMEAEAMMLQRVNPIGGSRPLRNEALAWARLFDHRYVDRTLVGVMVMFFQRWCSRQFIWLNR